MASPEREIGLNPSRSEMAVLVSQYGKAQTRCSRLIAEQAALIEALQADQMRLRAQLVIRTTALQFEREDRARVEALVPGLPRRVILARQVEQLRLRLEALLRERTHWRWGGERRGVSPQPPLADDRAQCATSAAVSFLLPQETACCTEAVPCAHSNGVDGHSDAVMQGQQETELLICRTGCISHGDYWRIRDQCRRTGKACILIDEHQAIHAMRQGEGVVVQACPVHSL